MKKLLAFVVVLCMLIPLAACGGSSSSSSTAPTSAGDAATTDTGSSAASPADDTVYTMTICHDEVLDSPQHQAMLALEEYLETESNGRLQVEIYPNAELGDANELLEMIAVNNLQGSGFSSDYLSVYDQRLSFMQLPFLFDNYEQVDELVFNPDGTLHKMYNDIAMENGFYVLGFQYDGTRNFSNNVRPIETAEDMVGLKVRAQQTDISVATFTALGCNATSMAYSEIYTALQQGVVDGQDNPAPLTLAGKFNEVQKYYSTLGHNAGIAVFVTSYEWLQSLPEDLRELVLYAGEEIGAKQQRENVRANEQAALDAIDASGCKVNYITDKSSFIEATQSVYDDYRAIYGDEFMDTILEAVGKG